MSKPDYRYVESHMDEYAEEYRQEQNEYNAFAKENRKVVCNFPKDFIERIIMVRFHDGLIRSGKEKMPDRCMECPMMSLDILRTGQLATKCDLNTKVFTGDLFFGTKRKKPDWCPLTEETDE